MDSDNSDNGEFLSADEYFSDEEASESKNDEKICNLTPIDANNTNVDVHFDAPIINDQPINRNQSESTEKEEGKFSDRGYRKRPEKKSRTTLNASVGVATSELKQIIDIVKDSRPNALLGDIKSHVTSHISKSLSTFQETSTSLKGLLGSHVDKEKNDDVRFVYDDDRTKDVTTEESSELDNLVNEQTTLSQEILNLSNAFKRLDVENTERSLSHDQCVFLSNTGNTDESNKDVHGPHPFKVGSSSEHSNNISNFTDVGVFKADCSEINKDLFCPFSALPNTNTDAKKGDSISEVSYGIDPVHHVSLEPNVLNNLLTVNNKTEKDQSHENLDNFSLALESTTNVKLPADSASKVSKDCDEENMSVIKQVVTEVLNTVQETDGWGDWDDEDNEGNKKQGEINNSSEGADTSELGKGGIEQLKADKKESEINLKPDVSSSGDAGNTESDVVADRIIIENIEKSQSLLVNDSQDGWGDFEDFEENKSMKEGEDGWGDWGDFEEENADKNEPIAEKQPEETCLSTRLGTLPESKETQDWKGWDSFGQKKDKDWGIGSWGISSLINTATAVSSNISVVTQGLSTVIETGLGVPDPESMARLHKQEEDKLRKESPEKFSDELLQASDPLETFPFKNIVAGVGKIVEVAKVQEIGSRVLSGGLGTLETIGKKTMEVLQEGDPGLKKKRALILGKGQALSNVLREARDRSAAEDLKKDVIAAARRCHFETVFDDFQGLVHLEALEMLSTQCQLRIEQILQSLPRDKVRETHDTLEEVKELCEYDPEDEPSVTDSFSAALLSTVEPLKNEFCIERVIEVHEKISRWLNDDSTKNKPVGEIYDKAISAVAELTATVTQQFHKGGELLILKERRKTVEEADCLLQLCGHLSTEVMSLSEKMTTLLSLHNDSTVEVLSNNLVVEAGNAVAYIKQAFALLLPVIQLGAI